MKQRVSLATHLNRIVSLPAGELAIVIGIFSVLATTSMHWVVRNITAALPGDLGDPLLNSWILAWDAERFLHGLDGFWDAPMFFPYPSSLAYSEHLLGVAIFTAPLQWLTDNPILVYNIVYLGSFVLAGTGMYLLTTSITGSRLAGMIGGMAFAFYHTAQTKPRISRYYCTVGCPSVFGGCIAISIVASEKCSLFLRLLSYYKDSQTDTSSIFLRQS